MTLTDLVPGDVVFVDANIFVYHFAPDPILQIPCGQLLRRIENQEIQAFTSTHVLAEAAHRLLTLEARARFQWSPGKVVQRLKQNPGSLQNLTQFRTAIERVVQSRISVLPAFSALLVTAAGLCQRPGLLITDALSVALMQTHSVTKIASDDADFDRVPNITRYAPA
jgi:predicted nucleic acid-binding protein